MRAGHGLGLGEVVEITSKARSPQSSEWEGRAPYGLVTVVVASSMIEAPDGVRHSDPS